MPPGAIRRYLQFPQMPAEEQDSPVATKPVAPAARAMPGAVPAKPSAGVDDDIQQQIDALKSLQSNRPQMNIGSAPSRMALPERPQASAWEALPQLFAGAGNVLSAGSNHPQDYLTPMMNRQQGMRDQAYGDRVAQAQTMFQNEREAYSDKLMRYSMELRDHQQRASEAHGLLQTLMEQKYLTGQKTPQDMQDTQKREGYRAMFDKFEMHKEIEDQGRELKATRPEDASIIDEVIKNRKAAIGSRGQGMVEYMTDTPTGRGLMESPQGPIRQPAGTGYKEGSVDERIQSLKQALAEPDKYYAQHGNKGANTKAQYLEKVKKALEKAEAEKKAGDAQPQTMAPMAAPARTGIASRLQQELQSKDGGAGAQMLEQWARKQRESKD